MTNRDLSMFLFDLDCTLVDSANFICNQVDYALQRNGLPAADRRRVLSPS